MKTTIAYKKQSAGILYIFLTLVGVGVLVAGCIAHHTTAILMGTLITILSGVFAVRFLSLPSKIIVLTERPAKVKNIYYTDFEKSLTPLQRREDERFSCWFEKLWKELN